jgi:glycolate oxidase iron-sulfur subunit
MHNSAQDKTLKCIRCGFCLDACPTFRLTGNEADSPRGRIYLMRSVGEKAIPLDSGVAQHLDSCLGCRACETACPSGVEYASILEHFRAELEDRGLRTGPQRLARKQLLAMLTSPRRLALALKSANLLSKVVGPQRTMPGLAAELLTGRANVPVTLPATPERVAIGRLPERSPALGEKRYTVGVLAGCVMRVLFDETNQATVRVLQRNGCEVVAPRAAGCCGALHLHTGYMAEAKEKARNLIDVMSKVPMDAFIVNSAGCGSTLKEYGDLLADDPVYAEKAAAFAAKVRDISEWLVEIGVQAPEGSYDKTVAYHDACHLAHGQKITAQPRQLLRAIPGLKLVDLPESDTCCGSAGVYNLTQPEMARRLLERKVDFIQSIGATVVATGNPGCLAWIQQGLKERGLEVEVRHPVEILDEAYGRG